MSGCAKRPDNPETGRIAAWEKRQPKRERTDDSSSERVRAFRDGQRHKVSRVTVSKHHVTPRNAKKRLEKRRVEKKKNLCASLWLRRLGFDEFWVVHPRRQNARLCRKSVGGSLTKL